MIEEIQHEAVEAVEDFESKGAWLKSEISSAKKEYRDYHQRFKKLVKKFRDEQTTTHSITEKGSPRFNLFWSSVNILRPAIYSRQPSVRVSRRFKDKDPVGRVAAQVAERATQFSIDEDQDFQTMALSALQDFLIGGRCVVREYYKAEFETIEEPVFDPFTGNPVIDEDGEVMTTSREIKTDEKSCTKYVHWQDFLHSPARNWEEVTWVAFKNFLTRKELIERFGDKGKTIGLDSDRKDDDGEKHPEHEQMQKACIWEVWHKTDKTVYWLSEVDGLIESQNDPLGLRGFFPCPRPAYGVLTTEQLVPIPDGAMIQDHLNLIDNLTTRMDLIVDAIKVVGCYDANVPELQKMMTSTAENSLTPVKNWATFAEKNGIRGHIDFMELQPLIQALQVLADARRVAIQDVYEITGISDILRGSTSASETASAQQIKSRYATIRLSEKQSEFNRMLRDVLTIKAEIISEQFDAERLAMMSGAPLLADTDPQVMQLFVDATQLLSSDKMRTFRIDIESDSTIEIDEQFEKQTAIEFGQMFAQMLGQSKDLVAGAPQLLPLIGAVFKNITRSMRRGRDLESTIDAAIDSMMEAANQPQPPDPKLLEAQQKAETRAQELEMRMAESAQKASIRERELEMKLMEMQARADIERQKTDYNYAMGLEKLKYESALEFEKYRTEILQQQASAGREELSRAQTEATSKLPPIEINVDASKPTRQQAIMRTLPDGSKIAEIQEVRDSL